MDVANSARFSVSYDGEALKDHRIDVRDLAPALLGIGEVFEHANAVVNQGRAEVRVTVRANQRAGSFIIDFEVFQSLAKQITAVFSGAGVTAACNLMTILGFCGTPQIGPSVVELIRRLRGKSAKKVDLGGGRVRLEISGGSAIEVMSEVASLYESVGVRNGMVRMLEPLQRPGVDKFEIKVENAPSDLMITSDQIRDFEPPAIESVSEELPEREWTSAFTIISLTFKDGNKWKLFDGQSSISAAILDEEFLAMVDKGLQFSKGDVLMCRIRQRQTHTADGLRAEYAVIKVEEHRPAPKQYKLFS